MNKLLSVLAAGLLATSSAVVLRKYSPTAQLRRFEDVS